MEGGGNNGVRVVFKNCAAISGYLCEINNLQTDNTEDINVVMLRYNLTENSDNYLKTGSWWHYYRDESVLTNTGALDNFTDNSTIEACK